MALATCFCFMPRLMWSRWSTSGLTYTGTAPQSTSAFYQDACRCRGTGSSSPQAVSTMLCTSWRRCSPNRRGSADASAASSASRMGRIAAWQRLSSRLHAVHTPTQRTAGPKAVNFRECASPLYHRILKGPTPSGGNFPALRGWGPGAFFLTSVRGSFGKCRKTKNAISKLPVIGL